MSLIKPFRGEKTIQLKSISTASTQNLTPQEAEARLAELGPEMEALQELLYAAHETSLLVILQGMDTSGKDGTIRKVLGYMNPQNCRSVSFKVPTPLELSHDFLWRVHPAVPGKGEIVIFNRSHYEDVLVVRVHNLVPETAWKQRYEQIRHFEQLLTDSNTILLKFFLHISKEEQKERLLAREAETEKSWKLSPSDWKEREYWDAYQKAYEDALNHCATPTAPWYIVPADRKWFRNVAIAEAIVEALRPYKKQWLQKLEAVGATARAELLTLRQQSK